MPTEREHNFDYQPDDMGDADRFVTVVIVSIVFGVIVAAYFLR